MSLLATPEHSNTKHFLSVCNDTQTSWRNKILEDEQLVNDYISNTINDAKTARERIISDISRSRDLRKKAEKLLEHQPRPKVHLKANSINSTRTVSCSCSRDCRNRHTSVKIVPSLNLKLSSKLSEDKKEPKELKPFPFFYRRNMRAYMPTASSLSKSKNPRKLSKITNRSFHF
ncbi:unnamed protein product [Moneuplotes crassus]|uniref:Uncharacterized protein n=1 Tax=Euplotes crassus TaxID=5936 RepID=A0AAD1XXT5_EUPCR|nr:unnamed protein product [Moneuplotes crassus]